MIEIDFENDLKKEIKRVSSQLRLKVSINERLDKILRDYLTVRFKIIDEVPRNVYISPPLQAKIQKHPKKKEILTIVRLAKEGKNLNIFQSKKLLQTGFHDHLMSEWNIYHFHLSLAADRKSKFVKQVNNLLFSYIDTERIILLGTSNHVDGVFADVKWIEILHDYFPRVIQKYKDETIREISPKVNSSERQMLWNKGYTLGMTKVRNTVYINPGLGRATSGHSSSVVTAVIDIMRWINKLNEQVENYGELLRDYLNLTNSEIKLKIRLEKDLHLFEEITQQKLLTYPEVLISKGEFEKRLQSIRSREL